MHFREAEVSPSKPQGQRQNPPEKWSDIKVQVWQVDYEEEYIRQSCRTFAEIFKEHMKCLSPVCDHYNTTSHYISNDNFSTLGIEDQNIGRSIKILSESMFHP